MSIMRIASGFSNIHDIFFDGYSNEQGDLLLGVVAAFIFEMLKQLCSMWKPKLSYGDEKKFIEVTFKVIIRFWHTYYSISLCHSKDYFWNTDLIWSYGDGRVREYGCRRELDLDERVYYVSMFGYYLHHTLTQFSDPKRSDFWVLFLHHIVTLLLICGSYKSGYTSVGIIVAMCHEPSDLLLGLAKFCRYVGFTHGTDIFFGLFFVSWIFFRLYLFPYKCILSTVTFLKLGVYQILNIPAPEPHCNSYAAEILLWLMVVMYILQIYWGFLIMKVLMRKLFTGVVEDVRSDKEGIDFKKLQKHKGVLPDGGMKID